jgi:hypothetical protein
LLSGRYHSAHTWLLSARTRAYTDLVQSVLHALPMEPRSCRFEHVGVTDGDQLLTKSSGCCCGVGVMDKIQVLKTCSCTIARSCDKICPSPPWGNFLRDRRTNPSGQADCWCDMGQFEARSHHRCKFLGCILQSETTSSDQLQDISP